MVMTFQESKVDTIENMWTSIALLSILKNTIDAGGESDEVNNGWETERWG